MSSALVQAIGVVGDFSPAGSVVTGCSGVPAWW